MRAWVPTSRLPRLLVGPHIANGLSVAAGVMAVAVVATALIGFAAGQPATLGAISASISDLPAPWRDKARAMGAGFALALVSTAAIELAAPWPALAIVAIGAVAFVAGLLTGLGRWALALSMQALIPMVFVLGLPRADLAATAREELLLALGGLAYIAFAILVTRLTDFSARRLVASEGIHEFAAYLDVVAGVFDPALGLEEAIGAAIRQQAALSEQLQLARALLLDRASGSPRRLRLAATIGVQLDAFDALVAAQCDVAALRAAPGASRLLVYVDIVLRAAAADLRRLSLDLLANPAPSLPPDHRRAEDTLRGEAERLERDASLAGALRETIAATTRRLLLALEAVRRLEAILVDDKAAALAVGGVDLKAFWPKRAYALAPLAAALRFDSPVLRYAVRLSLAMMAGALVAQYFGDERHGNWVLLTIAVVLRASHSLTRKRRDDRVLGTLIGCVVAAGAVAYAPVAALVAIQAAALALTHSFVRLNYRLASVGASITALVSLHLINPAEAAPVVARLTDTLVGAAIAHLFSYVWPRWEYVDARRLVAGLERRLAAFASVALRADAPDQDYRMARKDVIEAIAALSDSAGRMGEEPPAARRGVEAMAHMLMAAHALVAQVSAARLDARHSEAAARDGDLTGRDWVVAQLGAPAPGAEAAPTPRVPAALGAATGRVVAAARAFERAVG